MTLNQETPKQFYDVSLGDLNYRVRLPAAMKDHIQKIIATSEGPYEPELLLALDKWLPAGSNIVDIGGNIGNHSLYWALRGHQVQYFEPDEANYGLAEDNFHLNGVRDSVTMHKIALGEERGKGFSENSNPDNSGGNRIVTDPRGNIEIATLDELEMDSIDLIKIDVEGMEGDVLRGSRSTIESFQPLLVVETLDVESLTIVLKALEGLDYTIWDTYNDSPTQLMIPSKRLTLTEMTELSVRRTREELTYLDKLKELKSSLDKANMKYRDAISHIQDLNVQLTGEKTRPFLTDAQVVQTLKLNDELHWVHSKLSAAQQQLETCSQELSVAHALRDKNHAIQKVLLEDQRKVRSNTEVLRTELRKKTLENDELKSELARIRDAFDQHT